MNHIKKRGHKLKYLFILALIISFYYGLTQVSIVQHYVENPVLLRDIILSFGILAPILVILLQTFQTTISIIPSQVTTVVAGFIFGPLLGLIYSLIGACLGSALIFLLSKKYGKNLASKLFDKKDIVHFDMFIREKKLWALFLARISPLFPNDIVSFTAGLTSINFWQFNIVSTIGFFVQMIILVFFGAGLMAGKVNFPLLFFGTLVSMSVLIVIFRQKIRKIIIKDIHKLEKEGLVVEKAIEREYKKI